MGRLAGDNRARLIAAAAVGALLIAAAVLVAAVHSERRVAGTNLLAPLNPTVEVRPGGRACELIRHVPAGAGAVRLRADGGGEVALRVGVSKGGRVLNRGRAEADDGPIVIPLEPETEAVAGARLCVANAGSQAALLYGERKRGSEGPGDYRYRFAVTFLEAESSSLLTRADVVAQRFGNGQAGALDSWALWLALLLGLAAGALAIATVLRGERR
jgi:hypothetical protein